MGSVGFSVGSVAVWWRYRYSVDVDVAVVFIVYYYYVYEYFVGRAGVGGRYIFSCFVRVFGFRFLFFSVFFNFRFYLKSKIMILEVSLGYSYTVRYRSL